ncbi:MAG: aspartate-semialdehyde dehydrogenase [Clostridia bacterium]|jgi:aspartate-semialdehyde dehydrogenase|nr:aspartate-semialdehyde dehydrogenase [Clostridia bacterium]MDD4276094.1 aspartate-semialdehyde dehydrogenase [Clostridia bacterium]
MIKINVAVVGATGLVGRTFLKILAEKKLNIENLYCYASEKSDGIIIEYNNKPYTVQKLCEENIINKKIDYALFSAGSAVSVEFAPIFSKQGTVVIDNSSAWRMNAEIPLVVPEVNPNDAFKHHGIIANPNCSTIQCMPPLKALDEKYSLKRVIFTTFQAVSGSGMKGIKDLELTTASKSPQFYPYPIFNNCLPHIDAFLENGYTKEEMKMVNESRKILGKPDLPISATCVRVPIQNSHSIEIIAELDKDFEITDIVTTLKNFAGIIVLDDVSKNIYPLATIATGHDEVYVGRIRRDLSNKNAVRIFCVADNIRKGAASNAVQILELLLQK